MQLEWDETKRESNLDKHGMDFADMVTFDWDRALPLPNDIVDGEIRERELGALGDHIVYVVYTERGDAVRLISVRVATKAERKFYVSNS